MTLFLLLSLPLFAALTVSFWKQPLKDLKYMLLSVLTGLLVFLAAAMITWSWIRAIAPRGSFLSRYFWQLLSAHGIFLLLGAAGAALIYLRKTILGGAGDHFRELLLYFAGFFTGMNVQMAILKENWYGFTELFCYPLLTIATVIIAAFLFNRFLGETDTIRFLWAGLVLAAVFLLPLVLIPSLFKQVFVTPIVTLAVTAGAVFLLVRELRGELPGAGVQR
jgi:hypothetical protein